MRDKVYRPSEVANILGISRRKVYYLVKRGILKAHDEADQIKITQKSFYDYQETLSVEKVQNLLNLSRSWVYKLIQRHEVELYLINGKPLRPYRIIKKSVFNHIERHTYFLADNLNSRKAFRR